jgi:hypothetical protein
MAGGIRPVPDGFGFKSSSAIDANAMDALIHSASLPMRSTGRESVRHRRRRLPDPFQ